MQVIYKDSENVIHFARKHPVDGRLIPVIESDKLYVDTPESAQVAHVQATPNGKGCKGCDARYSSLGCDSIRRNVGYVFDTLLGCGSIGWNVREILRSPAETYRIAANEQEVYRRQWRYATIFDKSNVEQLEELDAQLCAIFKRTRPGFKQRVIHPAVWDMVREHGMPKHAGLLIAEQPAVTNEEGEENLQCIAYTQDLRKLERGIRTTTKLGRYLTRHWPNVSPEAIRDMVARFEPVRYEIWETSDQIVKSVEEGPYSCMKGKWSDLNAHPYRCYDPKYGWKVAVALKGDLITGRAIINDNTFVRTYRAVNDDPNSTAWSGDHDGLRQWLREKGYCKESEWEDGLKLALVNDGRAVPYLDGNTQRVNKREGYLVIDCRGAYKADSSEGVIGYADDDDDDDDYTVCEVCDDRVHYDYTQIVDVRLGGRVHFEICVCDSCMSDMTHVTGSYRGNDEDYYVKDEDAEYVSGVGEVDSENLPSTVVTLEEGGDLWDADDAYYIEGYGYAKSDDVRYIDGEPQLESNCRECDYDSNWYHEDDVYEFAGNTVAKDNLDGWLEADDDEDFKQHLNELVDAEIYSQEEADAKLAERFGEEGAETIELHIQPTIPEGV